MRKLTLLTTIALLTFASNALAVTQSVGASVHFVTPISITDVVNANFGNVSTGPATTYTVDTSGNVTTSTGMVLSGTKNSAGMLIKGSASQAMNISVGAYLADNGVTPSNATCKYGAGVSAPCTAPVFGSANAPTSSGTSLLIGLTVSTDGTQTDNTDATPTFVVTVVYN